jgi:hypothetical protein
MAEYQDDSNEASRQHERMQAARKLYMGKKLKSLVEEMKAIGEKKERLEAELKDVNAAYDVLRFELIPEKMEEEGVERVSYDGIGRVSLTGDIRLSLLKARKPDFFAWCRKNKLGSLITEDINSSTLKAFIRGRIKEGKPYPSDIVTVTPITRASITKG